MRKHIALIHRHVKRHLQHPYVQGALVVITILSAVYFFTPRKKAHPGFDTIDVISQYVTGCPELPPMDNNNVLKPDYTKFYMQRQEHYWGKRTAILKEWLGLKKRLWSVELFVQHFEKLVKERETKNNTDDFITKITPTDGAQIYVFGDLQGAFHSMTRCLAHMIDGGLLDKTLKMTDSKSFIILMGDAISRSPYNIETLSLINEIMLKNPDRFIYIKGNHESNSYWQNYGLKAELILRAGDLQKEPIPYGNLVNKFFNTLPHAVYIDMGEHRFIKIAPKEIEGKVEETEKIYGKFLLEKSTQEITHCAHKNAGEADSLGLVIKAVIRAEEKKKDFQSMDGMRLVGSEGDAVVWALLSCPTLVYQQGLKFYSDAFAVIKSATLLENWTITVHTHDSREAQKPFTTRINNLLSGKDSVLGEKASLEMPRAVKQVETVPEPVNQESYQEKVEPVADNNTKEDEKTKEPLFKDLSHTVPVDEKVVAPSVTDQTVTMTKNELKEIVIEAVKEALLKKHLEKKQLEHVHENNVPIESTSPIKENGDEQNSVNEYPEDNEDLQAEHEMEEEMDYPEEEIDNTFVLDAGATDPGLSEGWVPSIHTGDGHE